MYHNLGTLDPPLSFVPQGVNTETKSIHQR